eukprot:3693738-Pleurochrysis_carterae.AAC.1
MMSIQPLDCASDGLCYECWRAYLFGGTSSRDADAGMETRDVMGKLTPVSSLRPILRGADPELSTCGMNRIAAPMPSMKAGIAMQKQPSRIPASTRAFLPIAGSCGFAAPRRRKGSTQSRRAKCCNACSDALSKTLQSLLRTAFETTHALLSISALSATSNKAQLASVSCAEPRVSLCAARLLVRAVRSAARSLDGAARSRQ